MGTFLYFHHVFRLHQEKERVVEEKEQRILLQRKTIEGLEQEVVESIAKYQPIVSNRVCVSHGLQRAYPKAPTFQNRYDMFSKDVLFEKTPQRTCLSAQSLEVLEQFQHQLGLDEKDVVRELKCLPHSLSKPLHYLGIEHQPGIYCGGEPQSLASVAIVITLLQRGGFFSEAVTFVNVAGKIVLTVQDGVLTLVVQ